MIIRKKFLGVKIVAVIVFTAITVSGCVLNKIAEPKETIPTDTDAISEDTLHVDNPQKQSSKAISKFWCWHSNGEFKYPSSYKQSEYFVEDVPGNVEVFSNGKIQFCYWPGLGMWSTFVGFPPEGLWLSPTERVKNITYRSKSKLIVSGYTQNGNIFYLNQKILSGGEVNHSKVLVLIYPPVKKSKVSNLLNVVKNW